MLKKLFTISPIVSHKALAGAATATAGAGTTVVTLSAQLNEPHILFYLSVPFWMVIAAMLIVIIFSSLLSAMTERTKSINGKFKKFIVSLVIGLFISFVFIPLFEDAPNPARLMLWAAVSSFAGNVAIVILADLLHRIKNDEGFKDSLSASAMSNIKNRLKGLGMLVSGGNSNDDNNK